MVISADPITCKACLRMPDDRECNSRGRPGLHCRKSRCKGHADDDEQEEKKLEAVDEKVTTPLPRSPRWRVPLKSPRGTVTTPPRQRSRSPQVAVEVDAAAASPHGAVDGAPDAPPDPPRPELPPLTLAALVEPLVRRPRHLGLLLGLQPPLRPAPAFWKKSRFWLNLTKI